MSGEIDLEAVKAKWLQPCAACDAGLPAACSHPDEDPRTVILDLVNAVERERARREIAMQFAAQGPVVEDRHIVLLEENGWTIQHPLDCRPNLFHCPVTALAHSQISPEQAREGYGRYYLERVAESDVLRVGEYLGP